MLIIIEGPDNSGKTTLINKLRKKNILSLDHIDFKKYDNWMEKMNFYGKIQYNMLKQLKYYIQKDILLDRFFISTLVYSKIFNRKDDLSYINFNDWKDCFFILFKVDLKELKTTIKEEDKKIRNVITKQKKEFDKYEKKIRNFNHYIIRDYNYNIENIYKEIQKAK